MGGGGGEKININPKRGSNPLSGSLDGETRGHLIDTHIKISVILRKKKQLNLNTVENKVRGLKHGSRCEDDSSVKPGAAVTHQRMCRRC